MFTNTQNGPVFHYKPSIGTNSSDMKLHGQQKHYICDCLSKEFASISRCTSFKYSIWVGYYLVTYISFYMTNTANI